VASEREMRDSETSMADEVEDERSKDSVEVEAEAEEKRGSLSASEAYASGFADGGIGEAGDTARAGGGDRTILGSCERTE